tara:strand:- start:66 stop:206 length:141 start_codon:yes stop_codon:yes gene_type:complete
MKEVFIVALLFILFVVVVKQFRPTNIDIVIEEIFTDKEIEEWQPFD